MNDRVRIEFCFQLGKNTTAFFADDSLSGLNVSRTADSQPKMIHVLEDVRIFGFRIFGR